MLAQGNEGVPMMLPKAIFPLENKAGLMKGRHNNSVGRDSSRDSIP